MAGFRMGRIQLENLSVNHFSLLEMACSVKPDAKL
jgi:hypothetical protein